MARTKSHLTLYSRVGQLVNGPTGDPEIQGHMEEIATNGRKCARKFNEMMGKEGRDIIKQKHILQSTSSVSEVIVNNLRSAVNAMTKPLETIRSEMFYHQTKIHIGIELCRAKRKRTEHDVESKRISCLETVLKIKVMTSEMSSYQQEAINFTSHAKRCTKRANDMNRQMEEKQHNSSVGFGVAAVGVALAPFTGGVSLAVTAAGATYGGLNMSDAAGYRTEAEHSNKAAVKNYDKAHKLERKCTELENNKRMAELDMRFLEKEIDDLKREEGAMNGATEDLLGSINTIDRMLGSLQNMDTVLLQTLLENDSFQIIQNAFSRNPQKLQSRAQKQLESLKRQWEEIEGMLHQHLGDRLQIL